MFRVYYFYTLPNSTNSNIAIYVKKAENKSNHLFCTKKDMFHLNRKKMRFSSADVIRKKGQEIRED